MAPTIKSLMGRDTRCDINGYCYDYYSTWDNWGRWVALVLIVIFFLFLGLAFSCFSQRRRRRRGLAPMYGTGWMGGKHNGQQQQYGNNGAWAHQQGGYQAPPPPYMGNQATGTTFQSNDGYYGHGNNQGYGQGIELQQPGASYQPQRGGDNVYEPPMGPPPAKGDGIIR
ncbi:chitin synthesis regulation, resistance to congo red-domain-containing protein [Cadophora sp. MPI-SDFR-AT-0126]|nr:chitin synthesis regulation, resistance to congo red-domain-containing protein [Leotiomycetes sp. MPI-SDFR-AT-0126]